MVSLITHSLIENALRSIRLALIENLADGTFPVIHEIILAVSGERFNKSFFWLRFGRELLEGLSLLIDVRQVLNGLILFKIQEVDGQGCALRRALALVRTLI